MHDKSFASELLNENLITSDVHQKINDFDAARIFSIHWQVKGLLYIGVSVLAAGLGILIYNNINTIGHNVIVFLIALVTAVCFAYGSWFKKEFEWDKIESPNLWYDYVLLLGALTFVTLVGYVQYQYNLFGDRWGLATFIPFIVIAFAAYFYDHLGLLSMAIVLFASWLGITITPQDLLHNNDFSSERFIYTAIGLSFLLTLISIATEKYKLKSHFAFTYFNFAFNIGFIATLSGLFVMSNTWLWYLVTAGIFAYCVLYALRQRSFYVLILTVAYGYIALCHLLFEIMSKMNWFDPYFALMWFIFSSIMIIKYLRDFKHKFQDDSL